MGRDWSEYKISLISSEDLKYSMVTIINNTVHLKLMQGYFLIIQSWIKRNTFFL